MWIPKTEEDVVNAVTSGSLEETVTFDAKRELPSSKKHSRELAKDVAAMANDGGVIVYGIAEDAHGRPTILNPISLTGQRERIDSIVRTSIAEPPMIHVREIPTAVDPTKGYLVVVIPPSERAPHMLVVKDEYRYYGRTDTGNKPLNEGEVARLYERRQQWEVDREEMLVQEIGRALHDPHPDFAYLHLIAQPVFRNEKLLHRAASDYPSIPTMLNELIDSVTTSSLFPRNYELDFEKPRKPWLIQVEGFLGELGGTPEPNDPFYTLNLQIDFDGTGHLFLGSAAERMENSRFVLLFSRVAGNATRFVALLGELYEKAGYTGMVDAGLALTGIEGSVPYTRNETMRIRSFYREYNRDAYTWTSRVAALIFMKEPREVAKGLLMPLFTAMSQGRLDPFQEES